MKNVIKIASLALALVFTLNSCKEDTFKITGEIDGASNQSIVLEKSDFYGRWILLDSTKIKDNGQFEIKFPAPGAPDIYRLSLGKGYIYFPIDSTETINVKSSVSEFGRDFTLSGSKKAEQMEEFEKEIHSYQGYNSSDSLSELKKRIFTKYIKDFPGSIVSFYILTKTIDGKPLYSPTDNIDTKYFGAVATGFKSIRPDDPHTALLEQTYLNAKKRKNAESGKFMTLEANEIKVLEIELPDESGKIIKLSDVVGNGKPVAVIFSALTASESPEFNMELAKIYDRYKGNVEFYNVSLDPDQYTWRESAVNIPWITVYAPAQFNSEAARLYNVNQIPTIFVYDRQGELVDRPTTLSDFEKLIK